jgi:hypothetical protein
MVEKTAIFSEKRYFEEYKTIRNKLRKYGLHDILSHAFDYIYPLEVSKVERAQKLPWLVTLILKWVLLDDMVSLNKKIKLNRHRFREILEQVHQLSTKTRMPQDFDSTKLFMRAMAYQQFIYQEEFSLSRFSRQIALFSELPDSHTIKRKFNDNCGIELNLFLDLSLITVFGFLNTDKKSINNDFFQNFSSKCSQDDINNFLALISKPIVEIREVLRQKGCQRLASEYFAPSLFIEYPLIQDGDNHFCVHPNLLFRCLENLIYDQIKSWNDSKSLQKFQQSFESYVGNTMKYYKLFHFTEKQIQDSYGRSGGQIDFVIAESESNVFIDAKGVEMPDQGKVTHSADILKDKSVHIIKAIKQAHEVLNKISEESDKGLLRFKKENFLIVVTFKELNIGNGSMLYEAVAKEKLDKLFSQYKELIPVENMYFVTIDEFDLLCDLAKQEQKELNHYLIKAREDDKEPQTSCFVMGMHLQKWRHNYPVFELAKNRSDWSGYTI